MAAPAGNSYYLLRSKHGRDKIFETPADLWNAFLEYVEHVEQNPLYKSEPVKYEGKCTLVEIPVMRAMILPDFARFCGCSDKYFDAFEKRVKGDEDFIRVIGDIKSAMYAQKFHGAAGGLLKENIIARELGLKDHTDLTSKDEKIGDELNAFKDLSFEQLLKLRNGHKPTGDDRISA